MIHYTTGNLLEAQVEALVNTVNTVGIMGKGIALMFKERFPENMEAYTAACKAQEVQVGRMFVTENAELVGPRWIINFPTKKHWRHPSKIEWIEEGLQDLRRVIQEKQIRSVAVPPLGAGNGGLAWPDVRCLIEDALGGLDDVEITLFEPTARYQNVSKKSGVEKLTPPRAMMVELVRRYSLLGIECSMLEVQKLAWFLVRAIREDGLADPMKLRFKAMNYGPYAPNLAHLLNSLDGSYLKSDKRIPDSKPNDIVWFDDTRKEFVASYLENDARSYLPALHRASEMIKGFESPYGLELLSTVDWLLTREQVEPEVDAVMEGIQRWPAGEAWAQRKTRLFDAYSVEIALKHLLGFQKQGTP